MLIPITITSSSLSNPKLPSGLAKISHDEVVLVELQGSLEVECNHPNERNGKLVGQLKIDDSTGRPSLLIGHHLLEGTIASLPKPFAVLLRSGSSENELGNDAMVLDSSSTGPGPEGLGDSISSSWSVVGIVKKKIVFSKRPMPV
ncbi:hypothetical protein BYT27DRAFT_7146225, partial [Phlegmacium glaucopus]